MDEYVQMRAGAIRARQIDTLIGLAKGIVADGIVTQGEAEFLQNWLLMNEATVTTNVAFERIDNKLRQVLEDRHLDKKEAEELLQELYRFAGEIPEEGELFKSAEFPLDDPPPKVVFDHRRFVLTGKFAYGTRKACQQATKDRGGKIQANVTQVTDYLVLGHYVTPSWKHESFGLKIAKAMDYRDAYDLPLAIISEEHWAKSGKIV